MHILTEDETTEIAGGTLLGDSLMATNAIGGGLLGAMLGGPVGALLGVVVGAATGQTVGDAIVPLIEQPHTK